MPFYIVTINKNIVQIHQNKVIHVTSQHHIHKMLKGRRCIAKPKQKHGVFNQPIPSDKRSPFTSIANQLDLVVPTTQANCRQEAHFGQLVKQVIYTWQWINIFLCLSALHSVDNCHLQFPSLLPNKDHERPIRQVRWMNSPLFKVFVKLPSHFC